MAICGVALTASGEGDECAQTAVAQPPGYPHVAALPPVLAPTVLQLPEPSPVLVLEIRQFVCLSNLKCVFYCSVSNSCYRVVIRVLWRIEEYSTVLGHQGGTIDLDTSLSIY